MGEDLAGGVVLIGGKSKKQRPTFHWENQLGGVGKKGKAEKRDCIPQGEKKKKL